MEVHKTEIAGICTLLTPVSLPQIPLLIDSPHSGRVYPEDFEFCCDLHTLHSAEDNCLDLLLQNTPQCGATYLQCEFPRSYIDVNRAPDDIDEQLLQHPPTQPLNPSLRSHAGYGLVRRLVRPGIAVYDRYLTLEEIRHRLEFCYIPYHTTLQQQLDRLYYHFGQVWYLDMHSMPAASAHSQDGHPVDFVLGDRHGTTCRRDFVHALKDFLKYLGYRVALNDPYKGVELIRRYGHPSIGRNALQIEINKNLYWDELTHEILPNFSVLKDHLEQLGFFAAHFIEKELVLKAAD
ncbi:MAG: N-formylglutamate amidohydrolase [Rhodospirillales bacterium]|nr:N-formylglutamate amidohydrolase [Rhodospirillales bacterium]